MRFPLRRAVAVLVAATCCGCSGGPDDMPETAPVRGRITISGQPLADAQVTFAPVAGGQSSDGRTNANGEFELTYKRDIRGAKLGKHKVYISTYEAPEVTDDGKTVGGVKERVPSQYNTATTLEREVTADPDANVFEFKL